MDSHRVEELKQKAKAIRDAKIEAANREYQDAIAAVECVRLLETADMAGRPASANGRAPRGALLKAIRGVLPKLVGDFTSEDLLRQIRNESPDCPPTQHKASVASAIRKLVEDGTLSEVVRPQGRRAGVYRTKNQEEPSAQTDGSRNSFPR